MTPAWPRWTRTACGSAPRPGRTCPPSAARRPPSCADSGFAGSESTDYPPQGPPEGDRRAPETPMSHRQRQSRRRRRQGRPQQGPARPRRRRHHLHHRGSLARGIRTRDRGHGSGSRRAEAHRQGPELRDLRRGRFPARLRAGGRRAHRHSLEPDPHGAPARDRGHRGRALLQAQGRGLQRHRQSRRPQPGVGREPPGRFHDHAAAGASALHQGPAAQPRRARSGRPSSPRSSRTSTPRPGSCTTT